MNLSSTFYLLSFFSLLSYATTSQEILLEPSFTRHQPILNLNSTKKTTELTVVRLQDTLLLPFVDDFSRNRLAPINVNASDSNYNLIHQTRYQLLDGTPFSILSNSLDTSYTTVFKLTDTTKTANSPVDSLLVFDHSTYPSLIIDTVAIWNNYSLIDSLNTGTFDTLWVDSLKNDSLAFGVVPPLSNLWTDNLVSINNNFPINSPSVGVATLDAVDYYGYLYPQGSSAAFTGDSLTSKNINLQNLTSTDGLLLSFMVEPGGIGDEPESTDKLILQFKDSSNAWSEVWSSSNESDLNTTAFKNVFVALTDGKFFHKAFQFRFINYASLSSVSSGWQSNADQWHLDYIVLDSNRSINDNYVQDVCFASPPSTQINGFFNVPWKHYLENKSITKTSSDSKVNNLGTTTVNVNVSSTIDEKGSVLFQDNSTSSQSIAGESATTFTQSYGGFQFSSIETYRTTFNSAHQLNTTGNNLITSNDTAHFVQVFDQSYAHDDGTAEAGYGINSYNGQFALKYELLTSGDTLTALDIYFNNTLKQENFDIPISLQIWNDNNGEPGDTLYTGISSFPISSDSLNAFLSYKLSRPLFLRGTIYIGWTQLSSELLNIGLDRNTTLSDKAFYKISGSTWKKSSIQGAVMLRPRFGTNTFLGINEIDRAQKAYPNPAKNYFQLEGIQDNTNLMIYSTSGLLIQTHESISSNTRISIEGLPAGLYILQLKKGGEINYTKLIKK